MFNLNRGFIPRYFEFERNGKTRYYLEEKIVWQDKKTGKTITVPIGYISDGASGAIDIKSKSWWVHDYLCDGNGFDGESCKVSNWTASRILSDILWSEKRFFRSSYWKWSTFFLGGKNLKKW